MRLTARSDMSRSGPSGAGGADSGAGVFFSSTSATATAASAFLLAIFPRLRNCPKSRAGGGAFAGLPPVVEFNGLAAQAQDPKRLQPPPVCFARIGDPPRLGR